MVVAGRLLLRLASPADWTEGELFSASVYASPQLRPLLTSPLDFLLTAVAAAALVALALYAIEGWRQSRRRRRAVDTPPRLAAYMAAQLAAGAVLAGLLVVYQGFLQDTLANTTLDLLQLSLHPWNAARVAMQIALIAWHATALGFGVLVLRTAGIGWRVGRRSWGTIAVAIACWIAPLAIWQLAAGWARADVLPLQVGAAAAITVAVWGTRLKARYRHGSQGFRLIVLDAGPDHPGVGVLPLDLPARVALQDAADRDALRPAGAQPARDDQGARSRKASARSTRSPNCRAWSSARPAPAAGPATDRAFEVWQRHGAGHADDLVARAVQRRTARSSAGSPSTCPRTSAPSTASRSSRATGTCTRRSRRSSPKSGACCARAARVCAGDGRRLGSIVVYAMLDYADLPFISSQSPYVAVLRRDEDSPVEGLSGRDVEYAVYGWSRAAALRVARDGVAARATRRSRASSRFARSVLDRAARAATSSTTSTC